MAKEKRSNGAAKKCVNVSADQQSMHNILPCFRGSLAHVRPSTAPAISMSCAKKGLQQKSIQKGFSDQNSKWLKPSVARHEAEEEEGGGHKGFAYFVCLH